MLRARHLIGSCAVALSFAASMPSDVSACGGCFHPENNPTESTVVTAHRMALSVSKDQTILWDQVQYAGNPSEFAWVLPVKPGAVLELSTDAWFEALDATTTTRVTAPSCNGNGNFGGYDGGGSSGCGIGCAASDAGGYGTGGSGGGAGGPRQAVPPPVTVVHQGTVGPYETVTLHSKVKGALTDWLKGHGYAIDASIQTVVDNYEKEGFDFIALRLQPGQGVQSMKPVRVRTVGASPTLPLRMVAAGTGANVAITLFVIGEGRWTTQNFPSMTQDPTAIVWDFPSSSSNYASLRAQDLALDDGRTWLTTFAKRGALLSQQVAPGFGPINYSIGNTLSVSTIADAYAVQGELNGETSDTTCRDAFALWANSAREVVACASTSGSGGAGAGGAGAGGAGSSSSNASSSSSASSSGSTGGAGGAGATGSGGGSSSSTTGSSASSASGGGAGGGGGAPTCAVEPFSQIDSRDFACGPLDDIAVALVGMHPDDVWITRLESSLPRAALSEDLQLQADGTQASVENVVLATSTSSQCSTFGAPPPVGLFGRGNGSATRTRHELALYAAIFSAIAALVVRRGRRPSLATTAMPPTRRRAARRAV